MAEISGIDSRTAAEARPTATPSRTAINRYAVVVFHDQKLDDDQQIDFARNFGPIDASAQKARHRGIKHRLDSNEIADISNLDGDGKVLAARRPRRLDWLANRLWHTDASFRAVPGALSMLYAHVVPDEGGETEFADLRAAYDALPTATKEQLEGLVAEHSIWHSRGQLGVTKYTDRRRARACRRCRSAWCAPIPARIARRSIVAAHASHIVGMPIADGRLLLLDLIEHATQPRIRPRPHLEARATW